MPRRREFLKYFKIKTLGNDISCAYNLELSIGTYIDDIMSENDNQTKFLHRYQNFATKGLGCRLFQYYFCHLETKHKNNYINSP